MQDTHTAPSQRWQILALGVAILGLLVGIWHPFGLWGAFLALAAFGITAVPFSGFILRRDYAVLLAAPLLLFVRALTLGLGLALGLIGLRQRTTPRSPTLSWYERGLKRAMDILVSSVALLVGLPLFGLIALAIKLDSHGSVFFVQQRIGENGRSFRMIKFRSMVQDADKRFDKIAARNPLQGPAVKLPDDPRVTRVGRVLRRWSLDEIPQFWNVLWGDMSLVGPRPEEPKVVAQYSDWHRRRLAIRPGLTGPMQVNGRGELPLDERVQLELEYMQHYSLWEDVVTLAKTIPAVITGKGAF